MTDLIDPNSLPSGHAPVACPLCGGLVSSYPTPTFTLEEFPLSSNSEVSRILADTADMINTVIRDHVHRMHPDDVHRAPPQYR